MKTMNIDQAAEFLCLSPYTLRVLVKAGKVPGAKVGGEWRFTDESLEEFMRDEVRQQTAKRRGMTLVPVQSPSVPGAITRTVRRRPRTPPPLTSV